MTEVKPSIVARLRAAGCVFAEDEAEMLVAEAGTAGQLEEMVVRRVSGLPLEHVLGWAEFCGLRIKVQERVFVPRPRTEFLAGQAIEIASRLRQPVVVDLCCGSGALGAAMISAVAGTRLYAADIDPVAVSCARGNLASSGEVFQGDLYEALPPALRGGVDVLVANVPYVPTDDVALMPREARLYEALVALDGGRDGLDVLRRVAAGAPDWLAPGASLLIETSERQAPRAVEIFKECGLVPRVTRSEELEATVVIGHN